MDAAEGVVCTTLDSYVIKCLPLLHGPHTFCYNVWTYTLALHPCWQVARLLGITLVRTRPTPVMLQARPCSRKGLV